MTLHKVQRCRCLAGERIGWFGPLREEIKAGAGDRLTLRPLPVADR